MAIVVEGDPKAPLSIATTLRCRGGRYFFPWIATLYWVLSKVASSTVFESLVWLRPGIEPRSRGPMANTLMFTTPIYYKYIIICFQSNTFWFKFSLVLHYYPSLYIWFSLLCRHILHGSSYYNFSVTTGFPSDRQHTFCCSIGDERNSVDFNQRLFHFGRNE